MVALYYSRDVNISAADLALVSQFIEGLSQLSRDTAIYLDTFNVAVQLLNEGEAIGCLGVIDGTSQYAFDTELDPLA